MKTKRLQVALIIAILLKRNSNIKKNRRFSVNEYYKKREKDGEFHRKYVLLRQFPGRFFNYTRMEIPVFDKLLNLLRKK